MIIARVCLCAYRVGRFLSLGGWLEGPYFCQNGVIAGCSMATTLIRVYCLEGYDSIPLPPSTSLDVYIDDQGLSSTGRPRAVVNSVVSGALALDKVVQQVFGCSFALDKTAIVASSKSVGTQVLDRLSHLCNNCSGTTVNLGVDFTAGRAVRVSGRSAKMKARIAKSGRAARRLARQGKAISRNTALKVFSAGPLVGASYGAEVTGISDNDLLLMRRRLFFRSCDRTVG